MRRSAVHLYVYETRENGGSERSGLDCGYGYFGDRVINNNRFRDELRLMWLKADQASALNLGRTPTPKLTPHRHQRQQQAQEDRALHLLEYATVVLNH